MGKGRDAAAVVATVLLLNNENASAATFTTFHAGDVLERHNVGVVDKQGYDACKASEGATIFQSGSDQVTLVKGQNYFIRNFPGHCESKMKIAVNAL
ncbi:hypothetical protein CIPAW_05G014600 [Carya illinoinensis]|uniref:Phytocyanin domain-containing protein n=1 Tax=Carya illinoinensis TaxID=32201 RepID=A0A8T1QE82_CARIL|nr:hypothetical protein CIPAW_05G014600 [Carya illinoinensis]